MFGSVFLSLFWLLVLCFADYLYFCGKFMSMYEFLEGAFEHLTPSQVVINCAGVGYSVEISLNTYADLKSENKGRVFVHLVVREDARVLFGFSTKKERLLFRALISVSGIGANTARMMLSSLGSDELIRAVVKEDLSAIKAVKGIGLKTAQRVIIDLKEPLSKFEIADRELLNDNKNRQEALLALQTLGFNKQLIEKTLDKVLKEKADCTVEELIRLALKVL